MGDDQRPTEGDSRLRGTREPDRQATVIWQGAFRCILCNLVVSTHMTLWPSVCLSVRTRCSIIKGDEQIDLVLGMDVSFDQSYTVF